MELRESLKQGLERLLASGRVKIQENGSWLASLEDFDYEVREKAGAILLHLWSQEGTLVRRVIGIDADEDGRLALKVTRGSRLGNVASGSNMPDLTNVRDAAK